MPLTLEDRKQIVALTQELGELRARVKRMSNSTSPSEISMNEAYLRLHAFVTRQLNPANQKPLLTLFQKLGPEVNSKEGLRVIKEVAIDTPKIITKQEAEIPHSYEEGKKKEQDRQLQMRVAIIKNFTRLENIFRPLIELENPATVMDKIMFDIIKEFQSHPPLPENIIERVEELSEHLEKLIKQLQPQTIWSTIFQFEDQTEDLAWDEDDEGLEEDEGLGAEPVQEEDQKKQDRIESLQDPEKSIIKSYQTVLSEAKKWAAFNNSHNFKESAIGLEKTKSTLALLLKEIEEKIGHTFDKPIHQELPLPPETILVTPSLNSVKKGKTILLTPNQRRQLEELFSELEKVIRDLKISIKKFNNKIIDNNVYVSLEKFIKNQLDPEKLSVIRSLLGKLGPTVSASEINDRESPSTLFENIQKIQKEGLNLILNKKPDEVLRLSRNILSDLSALTDPSSKMDSALSHLIYEIRSTLDEPELEDQIQERVDNFREPLQLFMDQTTLERTWTNLFRAKSDHQQSVFAAYEKLRGASKQGNIDKTITSLQSLLLEIEKQTGHHFLQATHQSLQVLRKSAISAPTPMVLPEFKNASGKEVELISLKEAAKRAGKTTGVTPNQPNPPGMPKWTTHLEEEFNIDLKATRNPQPHQGV